MTKKKKTKTQPGGDGSPVKQLATELRALQTDLRRTVAAYTARLTKDLSESIAAVQALGPQEKLSRDHTHGVRDALALLRKRKLKAEKGRRKDLRKIDALIEDLQDLLPAAEAKAG